MAYTPGVRSLSDALNLYYRGFRFYEVFGPKSAPTLFPLIEEDAYGSTGEKKNQAAVSRAIDHFYAEFDIKHQFDPKLKHLTVEMTPQGTWFPGSINRNNWEVHWQGKPMRIILVEAPRPRAKKAKSNPRRRR